MEKQKKNILEKINSKYIINNIFTYLDYENKNFKLKLFNHSKSFQKKLGINLLNYKEQYLKDLGISIKKYLNYKDYLKYSQYYNDYYYDKDILKENLKNDLIKYNIDKNDMIKYLVHYYNELYKEKKIAKNDENIIDIYSPYFDILSKKNFFKELFIIPIRLKSIKYKNVIDDYKSAFNKLNNLNSLYPKLIIYYIDGNEINNLLDLKIVNLNLIDSLIILPEKGPEQYSYKYKSLLKSLASFPNLKDNLIYLEIKAIPNVYKKDLFDFNKNEIFDFKSLKILKLSDFLFKNEFIINITNLIELYLENCDNISFAGNICLNLKKINLIKNILKEPNQLIKAPELEEIKFYGDDINLFDYYSLKKLKYLFVEYCDIEKYIVSPLECISLDRTDLEKEKENIKQLISKKNLKK